MEDEEIKKISIAPIIEYCKAYVETLKDLRIYYDKTMHTTLEHGFLMFFMGLTPDNEKQVDESNMLQHFTDSMDLAYRFQKNMDDKFHDVFSDKQEFLTMFEKACNHLMLLSEYNDPNIDDDPLVTEDDFQKL